MGFNKIGTGVAYIPLLWSIRMMRLFRRDLGKKVAINESKIVFLSDVFYVLILESLLLFIINLSCGL